MIRKIIKIYLTMVVFILSFTKENNFKESELEEKIFHKKLIKIEDISEYLSENKEIKTIKFLIIFCVVYPIAISILIVSSILTTTWSIIYIIRIKTYSRNKDYIPMTANKELFKIHSDITVLRILKLIIVQIPIIKGFSNAYTANKYKKEKKNIFSLLKRYINDIKNIIIFSISPSRLFFITKVCLYIKKNINKKKYFLYYLKKFIYNEIYKSEASNISKTKKMKILKKEKELEFNPGGNDKKEIAEKLIMPLIRIASKNGPHWAIEEEDLGNNYGLFSQLTGEIVKKVKDESEYITLEARNYRKAKMHLLTNVASEKRYVEYTDNPKILVNMGLDSIEKLEHIKAATLSQRLMNRRYLIQSEGRSMRKIDLNKQNIYEHLEKGEDPINKKKFDEMLIRSRAEQTLKWYENLSSESKKLLFDLGNQKEINFHEYQSNEELNEFLKQNKEKDIF